MEKKTTSKKKTKKLTKENQIKKEFGKLFEEFAEREKELIDLIPDKCMIYTNRYTKEKYVSYEHYILMEKLLNKRLDSRKNLFLNTFKLLQKALK